MTIPIQAQNPEITINESDIDDVFQSTYTIITKNMQKSSRKSSGQIIDSVVDHTISILRYNPLAGSSYMKSPRELGHPRKGLIYIQNIDDNECFKWRIVRYLNPANNHSARIAKGEKGFAKKTYFKDMKFPVKIRDNCKIEKKNSISISVFGYENKEKHPINISKKCCEEKHVDLSLIEEEGKGHCFLIKDFNIFMYDYTLHHGKNIFAVIVYKLSVQKKRHVKDCFKTDGKVNKQSYNA